jgi:hypothetical protein
MDAGENNPTHIVYQEVIGPDGYATTKVPLKAIRFLDPDELDLRVLGPEKERYGHYSDLIRDGHHANGVPIVYRTPKGVLFASDLRFSDLTLHAEKHVKMHVAVPRNVVHPLICVKLIEVSSRDDIAVQRARYLEAVA